MNNPEFELLVYLITSAKVTFLIWFLFVMVFFTIISCHFQNLLSGLLFCHFFKHNSLLLYFIFLYSTETFPHKKESSLLVHNDP